MFLGFPGNSDGKESTWNIGDLGSILGLGRSLGGGYGHPLQYSCLENPHGQRSLVGYSPWGHKESDMTEWLSIAQAESKDTPNGNNMKQIIWSKVIRSIFENIPKEITDSDGFIGEFDNICKKDTVYSENSFRE